MNRALAVKHERAKSQRIDAGKLEASKRNPVERAIPKLVLRERGERVMHFAAICGVV